MFVLTNLLRTTGYNLKRYYKNLLVHNICDFKVITKCLFSVDRKSCNELRAYLANIAEQCSAAGAAGAAGAEEAALPSVVLLDNLQHASALGDAFAGLLPPDNRNMPVIIGTHTFT